MTKINTRNIRGAWIGYNSAYPAHDGTLLQITESAAQDFDTWLADIRAAAWEDGRTAGRSDTHDHPAPNPYRTERPMSIDDVKPGQIWRNTQNNRLVRVIAVTQFCEVHWEAVHGQPGSQFDAHWGAYFLEDFTLEQEATE